MRAAACDGRCRWAFLEAGHLPGHRLSRFFLIDPSQDRHFADGGGAKLSIGTARNFIELRRQQHKTEVDVDQNNKPSVTWSHFDMSRCYLLSMFGALG